MSALCVTASVDGESITAVGEDSADEVSKSEDSIDEDSADEDFADEDSAVLAGFRSFRVVIKATAYQ